MRPLPSISFIHVLNSSKRFRREDERFDAVGDRPTLFFMDQCPGLNPALRRSASMKSLNARARESSISSKVRRGYMVESTITMMIIERTCARREGRG